jgi:hypothetical protein
MYGTEVRPEMRTAVARLNAVPVDIKPQHAVLEKMKTW